MTKLSHKMQNALYLSTSYPNEEKNEFFLKIRLCQLLDIKTTNFMQKKTEKRELLLGKMLNWMIYRKRDQESVVISLDSYLQDPIYKETFTTSFFHN